MSKKKVIGCAFKRITTGWFSGFLEVAYEDHGPEMRGTFDYWASRYPVILGSNSFSSIRKMNAAMLVINTASNGRGHLHP